MPTQAQAILDASIARSLANDQGGTRLANNPVELLAVISRLVRQVYALSALPARQGGADRYQGTFVRSVAFTVGTPSSVFQPLPLVPEILRILDVVDAGGGTVRLASYGDFRRNILDPPPVIVVADRAIRSAARTGDPTAGAPLTLNVAYVPPPLTQSGQYLGATTLTDPTTSAWPSAVGDPWLVEALALYLAVKDGTRDAQELEELRTRMSEAAVMLEQLLGLTEGDLSSAMDKAS